MAGSNTAYALREIDDNPAESYSGNGQINQKTTRRHYLNDSDELLVRQYVDSGDDEAFRQLYERYSDRIYGHAFKMTGDSHYAEEIRQEVFYAVVRKLSGFRGDSRFSTWLYRVTQNTCYRIINSRSKLRRNEIHGKSAETLSDTGTTVNRQWRQPDEMLRIAETIRALRKALKNQTSLNVEIFYMKDLKGSSNAEVCRAVNLSLPAVKSRILRTRRYLSEKLKDYID